jgi:hypothetical protein
MKKVIIITCVAILFGIFFLAKVIKITTLGCLGTCPVTSYVTPYDFVKEIIFPIKGTD